MKKLIVCFLALFLCFGLAACGSSKENFSDDMKINYGTDLDEEYGADSVERDGDHEDSPYFKHPDFYNMKSTETLTILSNFKTYQQTSEWSCGVTASLMVLEYFGKRGYHDESTLAAFRENGLTPGATTLKGVKNIFEGIGGFDIHSTYDYDMTNPDELWENITLEMVQNYLKNDTPVLICWNDWGGHWQVIIGYDNMGTETVQDDVIIVADPYDTTDHNQDGYGIYPAERLYYNWTMYDFFGEDSLERDLLFLAAKPK